MSETGDTPAHRRSGSRRKASELEAELQSRIAEAEWLKVHYDEQLRAAFAQIAALQARIRAPLAVTQTHRASAPGADPEELERLRREVERLTAAETRYLDRIEELKGRLDGR